MLLNVNYTEIPLHIRGGVVLLLRMKGAMTTMDLCKEDFKLVVAPGMDSVARGLLYVDDGINITQTKTTHVQIMYVKGKLSVSGSIDVACMFTRSLSSPSTHLIMTTMSIDLSSNWGCQLASHIARA